MSTATSSPPRHDWEEAGAAWGHAAVDWSCLFEHYALDMLLALFDRLDVGGGRRLLDIACGSGLGTRLAVGAGAEVSAIDAAADLIEIARDRAPEADVRHGSMFELPWPEQHFDAAMSINGIWGGCGDALVEAFRVLRPGSPIGISFWGRSEPLALRDAFVTFAAFAPEPAVDGMVRTNAIARDGVAEDLLLDAGFEIVEVGSRVSVIEWPDDDVAWRALRSTGPAVPALRRADEAELRAAVLDAIADCRDRRGVYRFRNDHRFVVARRP